MLLGRAQDGLDFTVRQGKANHPPGDAGTVEVALGESEAVAFKGRCHLQAALEQAGQGVCRQLLPGRQFNRARGGQAARSLKGLQRGECLATKVAIGKLERVTHREALALQIGLDALGKHALAAPRKINPCHVGYPRLFLN